MLLKIALTLLLVVGSAVTSSAKRSLDISNDILAMFPNQMIPKGLFQKSETPKVKMSNYDLTRSFSLGPIIKLLKAIPTQKVVASDDTPKGTFQRDFLMKPAEKVEASDDGERNPLELKPLLKLRGALYDAYNQTYLMNNPISLIYLRKEHDFGNRSTKGSVNITQDDDSKTAFIHYLLRVRESPTSSPDTDHHQSMSSSSVGDEIAKKNPTQQEKSQIIFVSPKKVKSTTMNKNKKSFKEEKLLSLLPGMKASRSSDDLQTLPTFVAEDRAQAPEHIMTMFQVKPQARGYHQVWKKGQGLVVDREYDLPSSYDYRSAKSHLVDSENDSNEQPLYVHRTKPTPKVLEMLSQELKRHYQTQMKKSINVRQQKDGSDGGEEPRYIVHPKPEAQFVQLASEGDNNLY